MSKLTNVAKPKSKQLKLDNLLGARTSSDPSPTRSTSPPEDKRKVASRLNSEDEACESKSKPNKTTHPFFQAQTDKSTAKAQDTGSSLLDEIRKKRLNLYESVAAFRFNKKRVRVLSEATEIPENSKGVVYWMSRDQRVQGRISKLKLDHQIIQLINLYNFKRQLVTSLCSKNSYQTKHTTACLLLFNANPFGCYV